MKRFLVEPPSLPEEVAGDRERRLVRRLLALDPSERPPDAEAAKLEMNGSAVTRDTAELPKARTNISLRANVFVGRDDEIRELQKRIEAGQRLINVLGPGGTGKTRLAEEFGRQVTGEFDGGVWISNMRSAATLEEMWETLAADLGVAGPNPATRVRRHLGVGEAVLILDEGEIAADTLVRLVDDLLGALSDLRILVTSRLRLRHAAEFVFEIDPLTRPDARKLFIARARQHQVSFAPADGELDTIDAIVDRVERLPLAVELAAGRLGALTLEKLHERLREQLRALASRTAGDSRHATLRATIEGSFEMLSPPAQRALAFLSVFAGGGPIDAANHVLETVANAHDVWPEDLIEELWDHSMIRVGSTGVLDRFSMLAAVSEYAGERLTEYGQGDEARRSHAEYFARFAEIRVLERPLDMRSQREVDGELSNLDMAITTAREHEIDHLAVFPLLASWTARDRRGSFDAALELATKCLEFVDARTRAAAYLVAADANWRLGHFDEAREAIRMAMEHTEDPMLRSSLLLTRGNLNWASGHHEEALASYVKAEGIATDIDFEVVVTAHGNRGLVHWNRGELDLATLRFREALEMYRVRGATAQTGALLTNMANVATDRGQLDEAASLLRQAIDASRLAGDQPSEAIALNNLGNVLRLQGDFAEARDFLERSLKLNRQHGNRQMIGISMSTLGSVHVESDVERGTELLEQALELARETQSRRFQGIALMWLMRADRKLGNLERARERLNEAEEILHEIDARAEMGLCRCEAGLLAMALGQVERAAQHFEDASVIADDLGAGPQSELRHWLQELRFELDMARAEGA